MWKPRVAMVVLAAVLCSTPGVPAQTYPERPVRLIVASGVGGGLDFIARLVGPKLGENLGQTIVVDNRAGASGSIAAELESEHERWSGVARRLGLRTE